MRNNFLLSPPLLFVVTSLSLWCITSMPHVFQGNMEANSCLLDSPLLLLLLLFSWILLLQLAVPMDCSQVWLFDQSSHLTWFSALSQVSREYYWVVGLHAPVSFMFWVYSSATSNSIITARTFWEMYILYIGCHCILINGVKD